MSDMSRLTIFDGLPPSVAEPGEYLFYQAEPISVAIHFARHVRTATRRAMDSIPARSAAQRRTASSFLFFFCLSHVCFVWLPRHLLTLILMQAQATPQVDTLSICHRCEQRTWFRPCCGMVFCDPCTRGRLHERDCTVPRLPVLVPHAYITTDDGDRPPSAFVDLHRPEWEMYEFISGNRFVLSAYYWTADAYYFRADRGVRFWAHVYRRDGPDDWAWRVDFSFTMTPTKPVLIRWSVFMRR